MSAFAGGFRWRWPSLEPTCSTPRADQSSSLQEIANRREERDAWRATDSLLARALVAPLRFVRYRTDTFRSVRDPSGCPMPLRMTN